MVPAVITRAYQALNNDFHQVRQDWGAFGYKWARGVMALTKRYESTDVLDYGAGKKTLADRLPFPIQSYEPAFNDPPPQPADIVICTHVMEHVEPDCLHGVLSDLKRVTKKVAFVRIGTGLSNKIMPDGRDSNLSVLPVEEWERLFKQYFSTVAHLNVAYFAKGRLRYGQSDKGSFSALVHP